MMNSEIRLPKFENYRRRFFSLKLLPIAFGLSVFIGVQALPVSAAEKPPEQEVRGLTPMLESNVERPLRYFPQGTDFVITNGAEYFNRPLYVANTAFRIDGGDRPEVSLYLPGRGGNLKFGLRIGSKTNWLNEGRQIVTRYRPGSLIYEISGAPFDSAKVRLTVLPCAGDANGLIARAELETESSAASEFLLAFGGANGMRGRRSGDIGCENLPISEFFKLRPEQCRGNEITLGTNVFLLRGKPGTLAGILPHSESTIGDAKDWSSLAKLAASFNSLGAAKTETPVVVSRCEIVPGRPIYFLLQRVADETQTDQFTNLANNETLEKLFEQAEEHRRSIAERMVVQTPDPFINAAAGALNIAADAIWDGRQQAFMHGAVAWRVRLLGWRGPYAGDALGWHERTQKHFAGYARQQNTNEIPDQIPPADASANLSRSEAALHSNGDMTDRHYDMNLVAVDAFFRHLLWTGDLHFAQEMWPTIERHLAWERRLFRREFGPDKLPLYEAYAAIWASDDLAYNGGGATHASAYNLYHNQLAARVAHLIGQDATPYEHEAALIAKGMREQLWLPDRGWFAEWKDLLGEQRVHPNAAAWTFYHTIDSEVPTPFEAWQMSRFVDTQIVRIPLRGSNVPRGNFTMPTTSWMPYTWSLNNVVMAESTHTALAYWQAGRADAALPLFKGALLDSMYLGLCPGNVGLTTFFDAYRRETQRDFGDGVGSLSRALVQGLFGIEPDALAGELKLRPGFPQDWKRASIQHPDLTFRFERDGLKETWFVEQRFEKPLQLLLQIPAVRDRIASISANGQTVKWRVLEDSVGTPRIEIEAPAARRQTVQIEWDGAEPHSANVPKIVALDSKFSANTGAKILEIYDPQNVLREPQINQNSVSGIAQGTLGQRTLFAKVEQGNLRWWQPLDFELRPAWEIIAADQSATRSQFRLRNNTAESWNGNVSIQVNNGTAKVLSVNVAAFQESSELSLPANDLVPGANVIRVNFPNGQSASDWIVNWNIPAANSRFETIDLNSAFNDQVTRIFENEYLAPRSPFCSLATPKQGIGSWCHPADSFDVDDRGLRAVAAAHAGQLTLPQGIPFQTPTNADAKNILFTSQWNNYPAQASVPLSGRASHAYLLMAGSTSAMQSRFENGEVIVTYADNSTTRLALENPINWWPIDQDYFIDDFAFRRAEPIPPRVNLKTGEVRILDVSNFKGKGRTVPGGAATVLDLPLDPRKELRSVTVHAVANEVVIGVMAITLAH